MLIFWAVLGGFLLDAVFGDPVWLLHPVVLMGRCITALEKRLRAALPKTPQGELAGGCIVAAVLPLGTLAVTGLSCWGAAKIHPLLGLALQMFWCAQALAARDLVRESMNVYRELQRGDLPAARKAVARIVGRDTQNLTAEGVTKAAVETVAENASDGVIAPLLYMLIGGAPLALCRQIGRRCQLAAQPPGRPFVGLRGGLDRQQRGGGMAYLAAGSLQPRQPQQRPDRERLRRGLGRAVGRASLLFWRVL